MYEAGQRKTCHSAGIGNLYLPHMTKPMWHFRPGSPEHTADDTGIKALAGIAAPDLFFREALQNSIDEAKPGSPASVRISLIALSGNERAKFLNAFEWRDQVEEGDAETGYPWAHRSANRPE